MAITKSIIQKKARFFKNRQRRNYCNNRKRSATFWEI